MSKLRFPLYVMAVVFAVSMLRDCQRKIGAYDNQVVPAGVVPKGFTGADVRPLRPDESARVVLRPGRVANVGHDRTVTRYVPEDARVEVSVSTHGVVSVAVQNKGLTAGPGVGLAYSQKLVPSLDVRVAYWGRGSLLLGVTLVNPAPYVGVGYNVFKRTSFYAARKPDGYLFGVRVSL